jgi:hypothetical protein
MPESTRMTPFLHRSSPSALSFPLHNFSIHGGPSESITQSTYSSRLRRPWRRRLNSARSSNPLAPARPPAGRPSSRRLWRRGGPHERRRRGFLLPQPRQRLPQPRQFLTKALKCLLSQLTFNKLICEVAGRENMWRTCFLCIVESKTWSRCACVYGGWMMNSFLHIILSSPFEIFET